MSEKKTLLKGTFLLTASGILSRFIGFYNRIFLSKTIGAENIGIYQLIFPILMVIYCVTIQGIQTALTKLVASLSSQREEQSIRFLLRFSLLLSLMLAFFFTGILILFPEQLCTILLHRPDCASYLQLSAIAIPFVSIKGILHGYRIGRKKVGISASSHLFEQIIRVASIVALTHCINAKWTSTPYLAAIGMLLGEVLSCFYTVIYYCIAQKKDEMLQASAIPKDSIIREFFQLSIPLTGNRLIVSVLSGLQAMITPILLTQFYHNQSVAMELFGILSGMAMPFLFFPTAITNSLSTLVLPMISAAKANHNDKQIKKITYSCIIACMTMGIGCMLLFLIVGNSVGTMLFHESRVGEYIHKLAFVCPFFYVSSTLHAILNGLGKTKLTFYNNMIHTLIELLIMIILTPKIGIDGFIYSSFAGHIVLFILCANQIKKNILD